MTNEIPRRNRTDLNTTTEMSIREAIKNVESLAADERLTDAITFLDKAFNKVADYFDDYIPSPDKKQSEEQFKGWGAKNWEEYGDRELPIKSQKQSEEVAGENNEGAELWKSEYDSCRSLLKELVELKTIKDEHGKTEDYLQRQPIAWEQARQFLSNYQHDQYEGTYTPSPDKKQSDGKGEDAQPYICGVDIYWKIKMHHSDLGKVMKSEDCRFIGSIDECTQFVIDHKPQLSPRKEQGEREDDVANKFILDDNPSIVKFKKALDYFDVKDFTRYSLIDFCKIAMYEYAQQRPVRLPSEKKDW